MDLRGASRRALPRLGSTMKVNLNPGRIDCPGKRIDLSKEQKSQIHVVLKEGSYKITSNTDTETIEVA